ncbi:filamentation protein-like protein [Saccharata proteae CBS 121410]|uniref:Filamentation protein-like protein n=1 Tax=Saccharata proteae CBS 121410 TaxID=1314787 RepID=A0A9P4HS37_9PEZI|nr:filamentation protein-like protein [Saccharata proteae CBS 121410]
MQESEKALRYIAQLDEARCNARWEQVPELARKIEKHAPHRLYSLSNLIPTVQSALQQEDTHAQDRFIAEVCLGWIYWVLDEPSDAITKLPSDYEATIAGLTGGNSEGKLLGWTQACIVKGAYLKGFAQEKTGSISKAIETYESVLPYLSSIPSFNTVSSQFRTYTEWLLARLGLWSNLSETSAAREDPQASLRAFRVWSRLWENGSAQALGEAPDGQAGSRRAVWKAYYDSLSEILRRGWLYSGASDQEVSIFKEVPEQFAEEQIATMRLQQRAELKKVETMYEALVLKETRFPKASQNNKEIEEWVESVMDNWRIFCGPLWREEELGEGGKGGVGRSVLDILYRAATKSFHSTRILRHLFTVHASLAEFDLAFKAFDSYVEIVTRGKDRAESSGEDDPGLDDDDTVLLTAAEAIRLLCRFGSRSEAEKAKEVGETIDKWLKQRTPATSPPGPHTGDSSAEHNDGPTEGVLSPQARAIAYRAVGISQAQWARFTYQATSRSELQSKAAQSFRKALSPELGDPNNLETLYALGVVLAEMRDLGGAVKVVKRALASSPEPDTLVMPDGVLSAEKADLHVPRYTRERKLIPLWHLLALILTARSDFGTAAKTCEAAFEQFEDPTTLFGNSEHTQAYRSEHLNESTSSVENSQGKSDKGLVDAMEAYEKEGILQVKMTQISLVEVLDGTSTAVDAGAELLTLYKRLFGDPSGGHAAIRVSSPTEPALPQSSAGTIKGSIFGRARSRSKVAAQSSPLSKTTPTRTATMMTQGSEAPAIQVTDTTPEKSDGHHHHLFHHRDHEKSPRHRSGSLLHRRHHDSAAQEPSEKTDGQTGGARRESTVSSKGHTDLKAEDSPDQPLRPIPHNGTSHDSQAPPAGHPEQPPRQDIRLPAPFPRVNYTPPEPRFPAVQERRHTISLLIDVWLFIAGLYVRADMHQEATAALDEANSLTEMLEMEVSQEASNAKAFAQKGWGGSRSIEELWASVHAARGELALAQSEPYDALASFEKALSHFPDHPAAIVGLSDILIDIYTEAIPAERPDDFSPIRPSKTPSSRSTDIPSPSNPISGGSKAADPEALNRLAARDRAYSLLSSLTKLGSGWDYSEAWFGLARAYEESGQVDKAKSVLWWCVELEEARPVRGWGCVGGGGFVL